jgi:hypothetical protein
MLALMTALVIFLMNCYWWKLKLFTSLPSLGFNMHIISTFGERIVSEKVRKE